MSNIAFIDCFINEPVNHCVNELVEKLELVATYHMPSKFGMKSLESISKPSTYIILGSASHIYQELPWHKELVQFIAPKIEASSNVLGICFGHQLIAHHYGCKVGYIDQSKKNFDICRELTFKKNILGYSKDEKIILPYSHAQKVISITDQFESVASSEDSEYEIIKLKDTNYYGIQAHPESSIEFISKVGIENPEVIKDYGLNFIRSFLKLAN